MKIMQKLNLRIKKLNFPGTHWLVMVLIKWNGIKWPKKTLVGALHKLNSEIVLVTKLGYENREFYTLECLLYFWKHSRLPVNLYESQAQSEGVPWVKRQDRKAVISYLRGDAGEHLFSPRNFL